MTKRKSVWVIFGGLSGICLAASILIALVISKGQNIGEYLCDRSYEMPVHLVHNASNFCGLIRLSGKTNYSQAPAVRNLCFR